MDKLEILKQENLYKGNDIIIYGAGLSTLFGLYQRL